MSAVVALVVALLAAFVVVGLLGLALLQRRASEAPSVAMGLAAERARRLAWERRITPAFATLPADELVALREATDLYLREDGALRSRWETELEAAIDRHSTAEKPLGTVGLGGGGIGVGQRPRRPPRHTRLRFGVAEQVNR